MEFQKKIQILSLFFFFSEGKDVKSCNISQKNFNLTIAQYDGDDLPLCASDGLSITNI